MTQWIVNNRIQRKVNKKRSVKRMTQGTDSGLQKENGDDTVGTPDESESDAGSDIFMPGGITMKATELPSENVQNENQNDDGESNDEKVDCIESKTCGSDSEDENSSKGSDNICDNSPANTTSIEKPKTDKQFNNEDDKMSESGSPSSCLEINMEDDSAFPCSNKEKNINDVNARNVLEEGNIFTNISNILETGGDQSDDDGKGRRDERERTPKTEESQQKSNSDDEEPHMSEDFKIGLKQKSYDVDPFCPDSPPEYEVIEGNLYLVDKKKSRSKEDRYIQCVCPFEPDDPCFVGCASGCLNRMLLIECSPRNCPTGEFCTNRHFQRGCVYDLEVFKAGKKGWGLRTKEDIPEGAFVMEYCGEVVDNEAFHERTQEYHNDGISHYYFMTLKQNEIIDATKKGSKSRFINHSCDPNCETQKWTVNGLVRVGFFAVRNIEAGDELSFDYRFQRYGDKPQDCFCGADNCRGVIGSESLSTAPREMENFMANSPSHPEKKRKKGKLLSSELAEELHDLFSRKVWELTEPRQTLELLRLMVKVSTTAERIVLLKIIQVSKNVGAMKAFVRYKGLSLLWSWMVDAPESKLKYKIEILKTLKHVPVPNRNELDDSKVEGIVQKWSTSLGAVDSKTDAPKPPGRLDSLEDNGNTPSGSDGDGRNEDGGASSQDESSKEDNEDNGDEKLNKTAESMEEGEILEDTDGELKAKKSKDKNSDKLARRQKKIVSLSTSLMDEWKLLKEVFRIPKKSQTPDHRPRPDTDTSSPRPQDDKKNTPLSKVSSSDTFSSPPATTRHTDVNSGTAGTSLPENQGDSTEQSSTDDPVSTTDEAVSSPARDHRSARKREWRKSPDSKASDSRYSRDSNQQDADDGGSRKHDDSSRSDRRESRWGRHRRNSYDRDRDRRSNWNNDHDDNNNGKGGRWGRNRHWNDRNNRGNRHQGNRDSTMNRNNDQRLNNENSWNGGPPPHWNAHPQPPQPQPNLPPHRFRGNEPQQPPPRPPGVFSTMMGQPPPPNMMGQPPMNMIAPASIPPGMGPPQPMQAVNALNVVLPNNVNQSSPLISPMSNQQFNSSSSMASSNINQPQPPYPPAPSSGGQYNAPTGNTPDVTTLSMVNQLLLLNAERLKQTQNSGSHSSTPDNSRNASAPSSPMRTSGSSPTRSKPTSSLPPHWKTATDADGRVYYYHTETRETSWNPPVGQSSNNDDVVPKRQKKNSRSSIDSLQSPVKQSPRIVAADTTHKSGPRTPPLSSFSSSRSSNSSSQPDLQKIRDAFKMKISSVVVNCLNSYQKVDCKQGRIKSVDDFKFLARKLTHGLIMKERQRIGNEELLNCNDSVKVKVKEYIRNYMKKFGAVYIRS